MVYAIFWLYLLLHTTLATIVEDSNPSIHYDASWTTDINGYYSGGSAHHTNINGGTANYTFTGVAVTLYGVATNDGAKFSFGINGSSPQSCTSFRNDSNILYYGSELCSISGLDGTAQHTLTIRHTDTSGTWLPIDYLDVAPVGGTRTVTGSTALPTSTGTHGPKLPHPHLNKAAVIWGVGGGVIGFALCLFLFLLINCCRRKPVVVSIRT